MNTFSINRRKLNLVNKQKGATLFISLMLLIGISIISLAAMRTSLLELVIANNKQQYSNTFQAAEQVSNNRFSNMKLSILGTETIGDPLNNETVTETLANSSVVSEVIFKGQGPSQGWDLDQFGLAYHFYLNAEASAAGRGAVSRHRTGFYIVAPSSN